MAKSAKQPATKLLNWFVSVVSKSIVIRFVISGSSLSNAEGCIYFFVARNEKWTTGDFNCHAFHFEIPDYESFTRMPIFESQYKIWGQEGKHNIMDELSSWVGERDEHFFQHEPIVGNYIFENNKSTKYQLSPIMLVHLSRILARVQLFLQTGNCEPKNKIGLELLEDRLAGLLRVNLKHIETIGREFANRFA